MITIENGRALECVDCSTIFNSDDDTVPCESCGETNTTPVVILDCPAGATRGSPTDCDDDTHHWGFDKHVVVGWDGLDD